MSATVPKHLPTELLEHIFKYLELPEPEVLGREHFEQLNPAGYNDLDYRYDYPRPGDCLTPEQASSTNDDEYTTRLRTLAALCECSKRFHDIAVTSLYKTYPGQRMGNLQLFVDTLLRHPEKLRYVKQVALDPWYPRYGPNKGDCWLMAVEHLKQHIEQKIEATEEERQMIEWQNDATKVIFLMEV